MKPLVVPFIKTAIEGHQMYLLIFYFHASSKTNLKILKCFFSHKMLETFLSLHEITCTKTFT